MLFIRRIFFVSLSLTLASPAAAQSLTTKTVNIESPRTTPVGELDFPFTHRFTVSGSKVSNSPTMMLSTGISPLTSLGLRYATNSQTSDRLDPQNWLHNTLGKFNEIELSIKQVVMAEADSGMADVTGLLAYNTLADSADGAIVLGRSLGPLNLLVTGKVFSHGYGVGGLMPSAGLGLQWNLTRFFQLSADVNTAGIWAQRQELFDKTSNFIKASNLPAWSVAAGFLIPYSPHSVLLYLTNADTHTLQGAARGIPSSGTGQLAALGDIRAGFEFNIPFTSMARWIAIFDPPDTPQAQEESPPSEGVVNTMPVTDPAPIATPSADKTPAAAPAPIKAVEVVVTIKALKYSPGTVTIPVGGTVRWINKDGMEHTASADGKGWDSGTIRIGASWARTFETAGTFAYHCTPHPFMTGKVVVK